MRKVLYMLGQLSDEDADWLARTGRRLDCAAGHVLIRQNEPIRDLFILLTGQASVFVDGERELARLDSGEVLGEMSLLDERPPSATVRMTAASSLLAVDRQQLQNKLATDTGFAARFYRALALFLSDRMRTTVGRFGYGKTVVDDEEELPEAVLENIHLAGVRFETIMRRLMAAA
jgi:CRP-like cAMP-binding protein